MIKGKKNTWNENNQSKNILLDATIGPTFFFLKKWFFFAHFVSDWRQIILMRKFLILKESKDNLRF